MGLANMPSLHMWPVLDAVSQSRTYFKVMVDVTIGQETIYLVDFLLCTSQLTIVIGIEVLINDSD